MLVSRRVAPGVRAVRLVVLMPGATLVCDPFITMVSLPGTTAKAVALSVALFAENGGAGANPRVMHTHYQTLMTKHKNADPTAWDAVFREQTGKSINVSVNGVAKTLKMLP